MTGSGFDPREIDRAIAAVRSGLECDRQFIAKCREAGINPDAVIGSPLLAVALAHGEVHVKS